MVLTEQELTLARTKSESDYRIRSALFTRQKTDNFSEQAACDREIQRYLPHSHRDTQVYKFNCCVIHQPWRFSQMTALPDHGWDELGPTNEAVFAIYRNLPIYSQARGVTATFRRSGINNLNKRTETDTKVKESKNNNNVVIGYDSDDDEPGWGARLLSCIFA